MLNEKNMDAIWLKMTRIYGHKWTSSYGSLDDGTWLSALQRIPIEKVKHGLELCLTRSDSWPPSLPEFLQLCLGLPDLETVTACVLSGQPTDDISILISRRIGTWDLRNKTERELRARIRPLYDIAYSESIAETMMLETDNTQYIGEIPEEESNV